MNDHPRITFVAASMTASSFLRQQAALLVDAGAQVEVVCGPPMPADYPCDVRVVDRLERDPSPVGDLAALVAMVRHFRKNRPDVLHASTPKAAMLALVAGAVTRVPRRVYLVRGLRLQTSSGLARRAMWTLERLACRLAHDVVVVSPSLGDELVAERIVPRDRVRMIGAGASNGVDTGRFRPPTDQERLDARARFGIADDEFAVVYVGRVNVDKGLPTLIDALRQIGGTRPVRILLVGEAEGSDAWKHTVKGWEQLPGVTCTGSLGDVWPAYAASDAAVLPTRREGLPNMVLEASASGLPVLVTDAVGARDALVDGVTGIQFPVDDATALATAIVELCDRPDRGRSLGAAGRAWVSEHFEMRDVVVRNAHFLFPAMNRGNTDVRNLRHDAA